MPLAPLRGLDRVGLALPAVFASILIPLTLALGGSLAHGQAPVAGTPKPASAKAQSALSTTKPGWSELTPAQQAALAPLASAWSGISESQKRKWIAMSQNYPGLSAAERTKLHGRMTDWAALSPAQRNQARLSFAQTKQLSTEEKKTQWQAYQALSPEQKKQLASSAQPKALGAAPAVTPVAPNKLAVVPITRSEPHNPATAASRPAAGHSGAIGPRIAGAASAPRQTP